MLERGDIARLMLLVIQAHVALITPGPVRPMWRRDAGFDGRRLRLRAAW